ncbi:hypothetical protein JCM10207_006762 [Rhodosporidiobolus poonsookiae]
MSSFTYLITGASRGLGFAYSKALLASSSTIRVVATARNPDSATQLQELAKANEGRVLVVKLDVSAEQSSKTLAKELENHPFVKDGIDCLVNNAGIAVETFTDNFLTTSTDKLTKTLQTNVFGPIWVTRALFPLLERGNGKQLVNVSSSMGSMESTVPGIVPYYCMSKSALNMLTRKQAVQLGKDGYTLTWLVFVFLLPYLSTQQVVSWNPGWVKTEFGGNDGTMGDLTVEEATDLAMKNLFPRLQPENNGKFLTCEGGFCPW